MQCSLSNNKKKGIIFLYAVHFSVQQHAFRGKLVHSKAVVKTQS